MGIFEDPEPIDRADIEDAASWRSDTDGHVTGARVGNPISGWHQIHLDEPVPVKPGDTIITDFENGTVRVVPGADIR